MAKIRRIEPNIPSLSGRKRVAAYARVSMETELLHHSLSAQVSHYSSLIQSNPEWEYAGVYADEGITGTSTKKRDEFNRLMKDCDAGKIDLVLVKSISRFARDTVDTLNATRHLKDLGIDVFFEREGIHSMSGEGELLLTLLASFAQAEAESISANEKWSVQKRFERGEPNTGILCFGYDWNPETKSLTINEEEGKWVKYIYEQYLGGAPIKGLTLDLKEKGVRGKRGDLMGRTTLRRILSTETYVGDLLLQRYFSPEIHKPKLNEGEMEQILVSNAHEPLVSREDYAKVQERLNRRAKAADNHGYEKTFFAGLVKCGKCGYACNHVLYHRQPADKAYIECNKRKTKECDLLPIRELELKGIMEQIAGCRENVERITLFDGHIDFLMKDGTVKSHIREFTPLGRKATPFSGKISCGYCGSSIVRCGSSNRRKCWMCSIKKTDKDGCEHELMSDGELYGAAKSILDTEENLDMEIYLHIEKTISYNDRIEFYMKEGGKKGMAKTITRIPASVNRYTAKPIAEKTKRRVAGYARVSTEHEEQATSYEAQMDYYTNYITSRDDWIFVGMYSDEGITATNTKKREGFNQMIEDALAGKIDLIITKSVSRFARNTVDSLTTVRELKEKGVEIYFEKENIWTLDAKGELLITIMSSLAQEESRSISENTTWGKRKMFADGRASIGFKHFLGYDRGPDGEFIINEEQAVTVRYIYKRYLEGYSTYKIACELSEMGVKTPAGKDKWHPSSVMSILQNEKYKGDALLQKTFTKDFLTHKLVVNNGEVPQYYVEGHHEGIVTADQFDQVQAEILRRKGMQKYSGVGLFSSIIRCGECGSWYGAKVWHSNDKYRKVIYRCNNKYADGCKCKTPHINEDELKELFIKAANELFSEKEEILANTKVMMEMVCETDSLDRDLQDSIAELNVISEQMQIAIAENSRVALDQDEYEKRYAELTARYEKAKAKYDDIAEQIESKKAKRELFKGFIRTLEKQDGLIEEFDAGIWSSLVDHVTVTDKDNIVFSFKNGLETKVS